MSKKKLILLSILLVSALVSTTIFFSNYKIVRNADYSDAGNLKHTGYDICGRDDIETFNSTISQNVSYENIEKLYRNISAKPNYKNDANCVMISLSLNRYLGSPKSQEYYNIIKEMSEKNINPNLNISNNLDIKSLNPSEETKGN